MSLDKITDGSFLGGVVQSFQVHHLQVASLCEISVLIDDVSNAAAHASSEVSTRPAEDDNAPARHVFTAVIANAFDNSRRTAIANGEAFAGDSANECLSAGCPIQCDVTNDNILFRLETRACRWIHHQATSG